MAPTNWAQVLAGALGGLFSGVDQQQKQAQLLAERDRAARRQDALDQRQDALDQLTLANAGYTPVDAPSGAASADPMATVRQARVTLGTRQYAKTGPSAAEAKATAEQAANRARRDAEFARTRAGQFAALQQGGEIAPGVTLESLGDIDLQPQFQTFLAKQAQDAATARAGQAAQAAADRQAQTLAAALARAADKPPAAPTEGQAKDLFYYEQVLEALPVMTDNAAKMRPQAIAMALSPSAGWAVDGMLRPEEQLFLNAARRFTSSLLRKESGKAVSKDELRDAIDRYIDVGFDTPQLRKVKAAQRASVLRTMEDAALPAMQYTQEMRARMGTPTAAPTAPGAYRPSNPFAPRP